MSWESNTEDMHALTGAYAVDAVDDVERAAFERHLETCADCRAEVEELRATAVQLSLLLTVTPPEHLRDQVLRDISTVRPLPPDVRREAAERIDATSRDRAAGIDHSGSGTRVARLADARRRRNHWLAAAAAVVALGGGGALAVTQPWRSSQVQVDVAAQVQQAPDAQRFEQTVADGGRVTVVRSKSLGKAVLLTSNLPAPSGKTYQMWLQTPSGSFASAGLVPGTPDATVVLSGDAATALGAGVSVEPAGGSSQPTTTPIALFAFA